MKQKDIIIIIIAVFISGLLSMFISNKLFSIPKDQQAEVEVVAPINAEFQQPDPRYFNKDSINPTQPIKIGEGNNSQPFSDGQD
jgi:hypothetical protein